jgi:flagellar hook-length control protein FliK
MVLPNASASASTATPVFRLHTPVTDPGWDQDLGTRLQWLVHQGAHSAELRLNPPDLGAMDVRITSDGNSSNVQFFAASGAVRDALEAALPRLRELFVQQGLQLDGAGVSDRPLADRRSGEGSGFQGQSSPRGYAVRPDRGDGGDGAADAVRWVRSRVGLVDYYI